MNNDDDKTVSAIGLTPAQYHKQLDLLWAALDYPPPTDETVFEMAAFRIGRLTRQVRKLQDELARLRGQEQDHAD